MSQPGIFIFALLSISAIQISLVIALFKAGILSHSPAAFVLATKTTWLSNLLSLLTSLLMAYQWGRVAKGLGKSFWLYAVLAFFALPLIIIIPLFPFGNSRPIKESA
jgi:hypothetical protein